MLRELSDWIGGRSTKRLMPSKDDGLIDGETEPTAVEEVLGVVGVFVKLGLGKELCMVHYFCLGQLVSHEQWDGLIVSDQYAGLVEYYQERQ